jgi:hypothetical protein
MSMIIFREQQDILFDKVRLTKYLLQRQASRKVKMFIIGPTHLKAGPMRVMYITFKALTKI